jgi:hypothetical protein
MNSPLVDQIHQKPWKVGNPKDKKFTGTMDMTK